MKRLLVMAFGCLVAGGLAACSGGAAAPAPETTSSPMVTTTTVTTATASAAPTTPNSGDAPVAPSPSTVSTPPPGAPEQTTATGTSPNAEYCAKNQDPACPVGSFVGPDAIPNPNGDGTWVPCEGTICTNPNHGAGAPEPSDVPVEGAPCEGNGRWVHLTGGNAAHYGTEWLCARPSG